MTGGFHHAVVPDAALYTPELVPLLGSSYRIEVDLDAEPPTVHLEVTLDAGSAELLEQEGVFDAFDVPPHDDDEVPDVRLDLRLRPEVAAAHAGLLRGADDPADALLDATVEGDPYPPLAMIAAYDLVAWAVEIET